MERNELNKANDQFCIRGNQLIYSVKKREKVFANLACSFLHTKYKHPAMGESLHAFMLNRTELN